MAEHRVSDQISIPPGLATGSERFFDLAEEGQRLREGPQLAVHGRRQVTLYNEGALGVILFDLEPEGELYNHSVDGQATIQCVSGAVDVKTVDGHYDLVPGGLLTLSPGIHHDVVAREPSRLLLILSRAPSNEPV